MTSLILCSAYMVAFSNEDYADTVSKMGSQDNLMIGVILFGQALITFSMAMSTIFTDSKLSTQVGNFLLFLPTGFLIFALITIMSKRFISSIENLPKQLMGEEYEEYDGQKWL